MRVQHASVNPLLITKEGGVFQEGYLPSREPLLEMLHEAAQDYGASGVLIWQTVFWQDGKGDSGAGFNFDWTTPGNGHQAVIKAIRVMNDKVLPNLVPVYHIKFSKTQLHATFSCVCVDQ